jgi:seryl-tRNA synthetase
VRIVYPWIPAIAALALATSPAIAAKPKPASSAQLQAQLKKAVQERDEFKERLAATENLQADLAAALKSRDVALQETETVKKELEAIKNALAENQGSADTILAELRKTKEDLAAARAALDAVKKEAEASKEKLAAPAQEGTLVPLGSDVTPARPLNLRRVTPKTKKVSGVVVVNVLVSENGEVLDSRLLQGLSGEGEWVDKAHAACVEAAKRIVFDPARAADGKTKVRVWQGVGFLLD